LVGAHQLQLQIEIESFEFESRQCLEDARL